MVKTVNISVIDSFCPIIFAHCILLSNFGGASGWIDSEFHVVTLDLNLNNLLKMISINVHLKFKFNAFVLHSCSYKEFKAILIFYQLGETISINLNVDSCLL